tara:strand:+ start:58 stop:588 length:531 start_codon:yes stop_codon:yes gene_type:complete
MFIILPEHLPSSICSDAIQIYEKNERTSYVWRDTKPLSLEKIFNRLDSIKCRHIINLVSNATVRFFGQDTYVERAEIVKWPAGSYQPSHYDDRRESTTCASITYLNDDFEGGETYFTDQDLIVKPKIGRTVFFDGMKFEHGVSEVKNGIRYTLALWYTNDPQNYYELYSHYNGNCI